MCVYIKVIGIQRPFSSDDRIGDEDGIHFKDAVADQGVRSRERRLAGLRRANRTVLHSP